MPLVGRRTSGGASQGKERLPYPPVQFFGVVRHTERADTWSAQFNGKNWVESEDFQRRGPLDPPLSDAGLEAASAIGERIRAFRSQCGSSTLVVVVSPYLRCLQTAINICKVVQEKVRILIDFKIGEVYGPSVLGDHEPPQRPTMAHEDAVRLCREHGVACAERSVGEWPRWPEHIRDARRRYANRFLIYMSRSIRARRNFLLVTHADCVGAALRVMPSHRDSIVRAVDFGAHFLARRGAVPMQGKLGMRGSGPLSSMVGHVLSNKSRSSNEEVRICSFPSDLSHVDKIESGEKDNLAAEIDGTRLWMPPTMGAHGLSPVEEDGFMVADSERPAELGGDAAWQVETYDITIATKPGSSPWEKHVKKVTQETALSEGLIENLLGELSPDPLGGVSSRSHYKVAWRNRDDYSVESIRSGFSGSTAVFGESMYGSEVLKSVSESSRANSRLSSNGSRTDGVRKVLSSNSRGNGGMFGGSDRDREVFGAELKGGEVGALNSDRSGGSGSVDEGSVQVVKRSVVKLPSNQSKGGTDHVLSPTLVQARRDGWSPSKREGTAPTLVRGEFRPEPRSAAAASAGPPKLNLGGVPGLELGGSRLMRRRQATSDQEGGSPSSSSAKAVMSDVIAATSTVTL